MLKIVKSLVDEPAIPFGEFYMNYVMQVQDKNIDREVKAFIRHNRPSVYSISRVIDQTYKSIKKE